MIESAIAVRFSAVSNFFSFSVVPCNSTLLRFSIRLFSLRRASASIFFYEIMEVSNLTNLCCVIDYRSVLSSDVYARVHVNSRRISLSGSFDIPWY